MNFSQSTAPVSCVRGARPKDDGRRHFGGVGAPKSRDERQLLPPAVLLLRQGGATVFSATRKPQE